MIFIPAIVFASVEITHVEYDPPGSDTGHEWIEITNKGAASVEVPTFRFREGGVNHKLTLATGTTTLPAGASAIIASDPSTYAVDHGGNIESVFKSSFSLSNTGETLALVNASGAVESTLSYTAPPKIATPAPVKKASTKSPSASSASRNTPAKTSAPKETSYKDTNNPASAVSALQNIPPIVGWGAALVAIMALGTAGALYARMGSKTLAAQQLMSKPEDEFEIVEK